MHEPTVFDKMKMGFMMGSMVGACLGTMIGFVTTMRVGPGPRGYLATIGQYALSSGAMFGFFMSIGSVIRTDTEELKKIEKSRLENDRINRFRIEYPGNAFHRSSF